MPVLTPADHERFIEDGVVLVKNVADAEAIRESLAGFENATYTGTVGMADYKPVTPPSLPRC